MTTKRNGKGVLPTRHLVPLTYLSVLYPRVELLMHSLPARCRTTGKAICYGV